MYVTVNHNHNHIETGERHEIVLIKHTTSYYFKLFKFIFSDFFLSLRIFPVNLLRINLVLLLTFCQSV